VLYIPFYQNENTLKHNFPAWEVAYISSETIVHTNESRCTYNVNPTWGDLESVVNELENHDNIDETFTNHKTTRTLYESYDLQAYLPHPQADSIEKCINLGFQVTKHPFLIENNEYHIIRPMLNREQQAILKDITLEHAHSCALFPYRLGGNRQYIHSEITISDAYTNL
jgi:hypothetical protein